MASDKSNSSVIKLICDELKTSRSQQQLYGRDIDVITDVMDDVVNVNAVAMDDCLFEASDSPQCNVQTMHVR